MVSSLFILCRTGVSNSFKSRDKLLHSFFIDDHCLIDNDNSGGSVVLINRIGASSSKKLFKSCRCADCNQKRRIHVSIMRECHICSEANLFAFLECEQQMLAHIRRK